MNKTETFEVSESLIDVPDPASEALSQIGTVSNSSSDHVEGVVRFGLQRVSTRHPRQCRLQGRSSGHEPLGLSGWGLGGSSALVARARLPPRRAKAFFGRGIGRNGKDDE